MRKIHIYIFFLLLIGISIFYNYHKILFKRPQSVHAWRQADCASITLNYYQHGMRFFHPEVHNLNSNQGTNGYCATSEIPVLYYFSAALYKLFGPHEFFLRLINTLLYFLGLFYLFRLLLLLYNNKFWAIWTGLLFFTSPILAYYGNNFLTNVPAFSMAIVALFYFISYIRTCKNRFLALALLFFLIAGSFKVSALISLFAAGGFALTAILFRKQVPVFFRKPWLFILGSGIVVLLIGMWLYFASKFNSCHDCTYFSTTIFPIWNIPVSEIKNILRHLVFYWGTDFYTPYTFLVFAISGIIILAHFKKSDFTLKTILLWMILPVLAYIALQFWTFYDHDYYTIDLNIFLVLLLVTALGTAFQKYPRIVHSPLTKLMAIILLITGIVHTRNSLNKRYYGPQNNYYSEKNAIYSIAPYLDEIGVNQTDTIIFIPDGSNVSLYLMNRPGWTQYTDARFNREKPVYYNRDSTGIQRSIDAGGRYLIVNSLADIYANPFLLPFTKNLKGTYKNVLIFDLRDTLSNFALPPLVQLNQLLCDAELTDSVWFIATESVKLGCSQTQSDRASYSGKMSSCLTPENPYGMTYTTDSAVYGEKYVVHVFRKGNAKAGIIASGPAEANFYLNNSSVTASDKEDWEKLSLEFFVPERMKGKELKIYPYNPSNELACFDDLKILRFGIAH